MTFLVYLYKYTLLPICSAIVNVCYFFNNPAKYIRAMKESSKWNINTIEYLLKNYRYVPDWCRGVFNFEPTLATFIIRDGGDCSCWARVVKKLLKRSGFVPKMFVLWNQDNIYSFHMITVWNNGFSTVCFNAGEMIYCNNEFEVFETFRTKQKVLINGKPFRYENLKIYKWW